MGLSRICGLERTKSYIKFKYAVDGLPMGWCWISASTNPDTCDQKPSGGHIGDLKGDEHLQFYVGIFCWPTLKLLHSCQNLWIPCWNGYAIWPSLLICDWGTCFWFQCRHMSVMVSENSTIFQQFVKTSENSKGPHYLGMHRWPVACSKRLIVLKVCLCDIVIMICMWTFRG